MNIHFMWRMPKFPVIVVSGNKLYCALSAQEAANIVAAEVFFEGEEEIILIDVSGEEFPYHRKHSVISPSFMKRRWTKKQIIQLFNSSTNADIGNIRYSEKSLSAKTYGKIFSDLADLIRKNPVEDGLQDDQ